MNLTIPKDSLNRALRRVQGAVASRAALPIMSCVLLRTAGDDAIEVVATNHDMQISCRVEANVKTAGEALVPFGKLNLFASQFTHPEVEIGVEDFKVTITSGSARCSLSSFPTKDFSEFKSEPRKAFDIEQGVLKSALRRTIGAASDDETRFVLCGVNFELKSGALAISACSGKQLATVAHVVEGDGINSILPTKAANELMRLVGEDGDSTASFGANTAQFLTGDTTFTTKLIAHPYVNFRKVIPSECKERMTINREEFMSSVKLISSAWDEPLKLPVMLVTFANNRMQIDLTGAATNASDSIAVRYSADEFKIKLPPEVIIGILNTLPDDEVALEFTDNLSPFVIKAKDFLGLAMPLR